MALSFFGPGVRVLMVDPQVGDQIVSQLQTNNLIPGTPGTLDFSDWLSSVELLTAPGQITQATIIVTPPYDVLRDILDRSDIPETGWLMILVFGYEESNDVSQPLVLRMSQPTVQYEQNAQITFVASHGIYSLARRTNFNRVWPVDTYPDRALQVIREIASKIGYTVSSFFQQGIPDEPPDTTPGGLTNPAVWNRPITQTVHDMAFIEKLCRAGNADFHLDGNTIVVVDTEARRQAAPAVTLTMWGQIDTSRLIYPIQSFSTAQNAWFSPGESMTSDRRSGVDPVTGQPAPPDSTRGDPTLTDMVTEGESEIGEQQNVDRSVNVNGGQETINPAFPRLSSGRGFIAAARSPQSKPQVERHVRESCYRAGQEAEVKTIGIPRLRAGQMIELNGVGERFNGVWEVVKLKHQIDGSGFFTTLTLQRKSVRGAGGLDSVNAAAGVQLGLDISANLPLGYQVFSPVLIPRFAPVVNSRQPVAVFPESILIPELILAAGLGGIGAALGVTQ